MTLFSLAGSLNYASHTQQPESGSERKTSDTCGPKCAESFGRFNHVGLWAKTFSALLIGTGDWYSTRCKLTWKLKGTKYNRLYFQLQASTLPTKGTEFGLLLTPTTREEVLDLDKFKKRMEKYPNGTTMPNLATQVMGLLKTPCAADAYSENLSKKEQKFGNSGTLAQEIQSGFVEKRWPGLLPTPTAIEVHNSEKVSKVKGKQETLKSRENGLNIQNSLMNFLDFNGLLPTPTASDIHHAERVQKLKESGAETMASRKNGANRPNGLMDYLDFNQMLPTPQARDWKGESGGVQKGNDLPAIANKMLLAPQAADGGKLGGNENQDSLTKRARLETGTTSQLNPQFVLEMMGFPPNWTELPFLNGETNQSRPGETQSCPK
jgi:hypothetical protein